MRVGLIRGNYLYRTLIIHQKHVVYISLFILHKKSKFSMSCICDTENISVTFVRNVWTIRDLNPYRGKKFCTFPKSLNFLWRTSPTSSVDNGVLSGLKQKGVEDGQPHPPSVEFQNAFMASAGTTFSFKALLITKTCLADIGKT